MVLRQEVQASVLVCDLSIPIMTRCRYRASARQCSKVFGIALTLQRYSGGYCSGVPPLPIPNREVKPACADGTAMHCGRVGGRPLYSEVPVHNHVSRGLFLLCRLQVSVFVGDILDARTGLQGVEVVMTDDQRTRLAPVYFTFLLFIGSRDTEGVIFRSFLTSL